jgi:uncharacterized protein (DUF488 family)
MNARHKPAPQQVDWPVGTIFTIGHSTLAIEDFIARLRVFGIECLADIRTVPRSRHNPQFNADALAQSLPAAGIDYVPMPALGGLRHARKDSPNGAWRNASFRGYADYMQTPAFADAVDELTRVGREKRTAIMCAEAVPWRCHRSLVADALVARGVAAIEILSDTNCRPHSLTPFAKCDGSLVSYPAET